MSIGQLPKMKSQLDISLGRAASCCRTCMSGMFDNPDRQLYRADRLKQTFVQVGRYASA